MTLQEVRDALGAKVLCGEELLNTEISSACASDMMSDVLAFVTSEAVLITGCCNPQVIRTAEMMDIHCIIFVRGKLPSDDMIDLAREKSIVMLATGHRMFGTAGILYSIGLRGGADYERLY